MSPLYGVNAESTGKYIKAWESDKIYGSTLGAIVKFVDDDNLGITLYIDSDKKLGFINKDDKKGPWSQRKAAAKALKASGLDLAKIATSLNALEKALTSTTTSRYDLAKVKELLREKGLTLQQLVRHSDKSGDDLIEALLKEVGVTDTERYLTEAARAEKILKGSIETTDKAVIAKNMAVLKEKATKEGSLPLYTKILESAQKKIDGISEKEKADKLAKDTKRIEEEINKATTLEKIQELKAEAQKLGLTDNGIAKKSKEIAQKHIKNIKDNAKYEISADEMNLLKPYLPPDQKTVVLQFKHKKTGITYTVLAEKKGDRYKFLTPNPEVGSWEDYYAVRKKDGKWMVKEAYALLIAAHEPERAKDIKAYEYAPEPSSPTTNNKGYAELQAAKNVKFVWKDDGDNKFERSEVKNAWINVWNGKTWVKIKMTEQLFDLIDYDMQAKRAKEKKVDDSKGVITKGEGGDFASTNARLAKLAGVTEEQMATEYANSDAFVDVPLASLEEAKKTAEGWVADVKEWNAENVEKALKDNNVHASLIKLITSKLPSKEAFSAIFIRCLMASMMDKDAFGIAVKSLEGMEKYDPKVITKDNAVAWWKEGKVEEKDGDSETDDSLIATREEFYKKMRKVKAKKDVLKLHASLSKDLKNDPDVIAEIYKKLPDLEAKLKVIDKMNKGSEKDKFLGDIYKIYIDKPDLNMALEVAKKLTNGDNKYRSLLSIAQEYAKLKTDERLKALKIIDIIIKLKPEWEFEGKDKTPISITAYRNSMEDSLRMPLEIVKEREKVFPEGGTTNLSKAAEVLKNLQLIIDNKTSNDATKAYALMAKAEILKKQADNLTVGPSKPEKTEAYKKYLEMAKASQEAVIEFCKLRDKHKDSDPDLSEYYNKMHIKANSLTADVVFSKKGHWQKDGGKRPSNYSSYLKAFTEIAKYIPAGSKVYLGDQSGGNKEMESNLFKIKVLDTKSPKAHKKIAGDTSKAKSPKTTAPKPPKLKKTPPKVALKPKAEKPKSNVVDNPIVKGFSGVDEK